MYELILSQTVAFANFLGSVLGIYVLPILGFNDNTGTSQLADAIRGFLGPILLLVIGIAALVFLFQRQIMQMLLFLVIAIVVFAIFYGGEFVRNIGNWFGSDVATEIDWGFIHLPGLFG